ncbi:MAG TPA: TMEM165/GDT1 family protein [Clostridia bacterium]|nr:TMEM165/GDT1 family protein [Clostridia bacterium]
MIALFIAAGMILLAEIGDKTQLLVLAFAACHKPFKVMLGIFIATVANHGLAVLLGSLLAKNQIFGIWVQIIASVSFIIFGFWTIRGDKGEEESPRFRCGPVAAVAIAFFLAELGDKTQLTTISIAVKYPSDALWVLAGTTLGMMITGGTAVLLGSVLAKHIPASKIRLVSAVVFILFGLYGITQFLYSDLKLDILAVVAIVATVAAISAMIGYELYKKYVRVKQ